MANYTHLLAEGRIGPMELKNRIVVTAMGVSLANADGTVSDRLISYHAEQAEGGAGLIIAGVVGVGLPTGQVTPNQTGISRDEFIPGLKKLTDAVHAGGARMAAQLHHGGLVAGYGFARYGEPLWGPSLPHAMAGDYLDAFTAEERALFMGDGTPPTVKVLDEADIGEVVARFAAGARRAREAGFDGIEIHGGHGYIISSFLSPDYNHRTDAYGGSLEKRARLMLEVLRAVKAEAGPDVAVWMKLDSIERGKKIGTTLEDAKQVAKWLEAAGADAINVTSYHDVSKGELHTGSNIPQEPDLNIPNARAVKAGVGIPVIASGRVEPEHAEQFLSEHAFDFLAMGRKILADPHLPRKLAEGAAETIRPCIYCYTCVSAAYIHQRVRCAVNQTLGFEERQEAATPPTGKHYVVVGGGPAGMEAARRLRHAGNRVTLLEKGSHLGGTLQFAALGYEENGRLLNWLRAEVRREKVTVQLKTVATVESIRALAPDHVIVATGAIRQMPDIRGAERDFVFSGDDMRELLLGEQSDRLKEKTSLVTRLATKVAAATGASANIDLVRKASHQWMPLGQRIGIVGGGLVGLELAEFLAERGREVTVVEESPDLGYGLTVVRRMRILPELRKLGVALFRSAEGIEIGDHVLSFRAAGEAHEVAVDHVIVAKGAVANPALANALRQAGLAVTEVGDERGVTFIEGAMRSAARAVLGEGAIPALDFTPLA